MSQITKRMISLNGEAKPINKITPEGTIEFPDGSKSPLTETAALAFTDTRGNTLRAVCAPVTNGVAFAIDEADLEALKAARTHTGFNESARFTDAVRNLVSGTPSLEATKDDGRVEWTDNLTCTV